MKKILFNDKYGLTEAVLSGEKIQTRRVINHDGNKNHYDRLLCHWPLSSSPYFDGANWQWPLQTDDDDFDCFKLKPNYKIGEIVAISQSYNDIMRNNSINIDNISKAGCNNKMFVKAELMPHHIKITDVKVERLRDISNEDALKEGIITVTKDDSVIKYTFKGDKTPWSDMTRKPSEAFALLINKTCTKNTWTDNPYVWIYEFELID